MSVLRSTHGPSIGYDVTGSGPPLLLVHGITEDRRAFDPLVGPLAARSTVVRVDLRGHGESSEAPSYDVASMAADCHAVLVHLGLDEGPSLVGHSLGGMVVTAYAAAFGCEHVVNVDQPLALGAFKAQLGQLEPMLRGDDASFHTAMSLVFDVLVGARLPATEVARLAALRTPRQDVVLGVWSAVLDQPVEALDALVREITGAIRVPYLSLHGSDPGSDYPVWLRDLIPTATVEVWPDHGHYPHLVDTARFVARIADTRG